MEEAEFLSAVNSVIRNLKTKQTNLSYSITGSSVFAILGIRPRDTVKDIDIILYNPTEEIFISNPDLEPTTKIFYREHPITKIPEILKAKKSYNRDKDKLDIMKYH